MKNVKCECGHVNPPGTALCESCGAPLNEEAAQKMDMRYEGVARRSQLKTKSFIDPLWNFFSSVKNAIIMIVLALIGSALGSVFPQEKMIPVPEAADVYYEKTYGLFGKFYYVTGLYHIYSSWWFITLLLMIGVSLVVCSLDRIVPLYRALKNQKVKKSERFLQLQRVNTEISLDGREEKEATDALEKAFSSRGYRVRREGTALLGEKGRFSRWGPYVNHVGLIIFIIGCLMRLIPGFYVDQFVWVRDGQTVKIPETNYYVKNEKFVMDFYQDKDFPEKLDLNGQVVKSYMTKSILYEDKNAGIPGADPKLVEVLKHDILVNHPLKYNDFSLYQSGEQTNQLGALNLHLYETQSKKDLGNVKLDLYNPPSTIKVNDQVTLKVLQYFPNFALNENGEPITKTREPVNPAFIVEAVSPLTPTGEKTWVFLGQTLSPDAKTPIISYSFAKPDLISISGLTIRKDQSLPVIYFGCAVVVLGLFMGFYWQHRRIWMEIANGKISLAAHTNKNWFGLKQDTVRILKEAGYHVVDTQLEKEG